MLGRGIGASIYCVGKENMQVVIDVEKSGPYMMTWLHEIAKKSTIGFLLFRYSRFLSPHLLDTYGTWNVKKPTTKTSIRDIYSALQLLLIFFIIFCMSKVQFLLIKYRFICNCYSQATMVSQSPTDCTAYYFGKNTCKTMVRRLRFECLVFPCPHTKLLVGIILYVLSFPFY
jgi:hypothetical protein